ncbi:MAG: hypothetical protein F6K14_10125 [Symploca sp. SIO2C1]|nr:hypothetical protein [Symploca sp. SIO2C1]
MPIIKSTSEVDSEQVDIYIEVDEIPEVSDSDNPYQDVRESLGKKSLKAVSNLFGDGLALSRKCAVESVRSVNQMHDTVKPNEFEVQLAIKLNSEVGAVLTKFGGEAQMQVTMKWTLKEKPKQP